MARDRRVWHAEDIKAELRKRFRTLAALSRTWGYHQRAVPNALNNPQYSTVIETRIADTLGVEPWRLWPDRWGPDGVPLPRTCGPRRAHSSKKPEAA